MADKMEDFLRGFATGNAKKASIDKFALDKDTGVVKVEAEVRSRHRVRGNDVYSLTSDVRFDFDLRTGETSNERLRIRTNLGNVNVRLSSVKAILEGDFAKALELLPNGGIVQREIRSDYDRIRDSYYATHGRDNVYFASVRFVRWAGLGTAGRWVATAIASGGSATGAIMQEAKTEALRELNAVVRWLTGRGEREATDVAQKLLSGERVDFPSITLRWQTVRYASRLKVGGRIIGDEFAVNRHAAFVLIWNGQGGSTAPADLVASNGPLRDEDPDTPATGNGNNSTKITLTKLWCFVTEDILGEDETELRIWIDGRRAPSRRRDMNNGDVWTLNLDLEFQRDVRVQVWDLDNPPFGDAHDFLGELIIDSTRRTGNHRFREDESHYRVEWIPR